MGLYIQGWLPDTRNSKTGCGKALERERRFPLESAHVADWEELAVSAHDCWRYVAMLYSVVTPSGNPRGLCHRLRVLRRSMRQSQRGCPVALMVHCQHGVWWLQRRYLVAPPAASGCSCKLQAWQNARHFTGPVCRHSGYCQQPAYMAGSETCNPGVPVTVGHGDDCLGAQVPTCTLAAHLPAMTS